MATKACFSRLNFLLPRRLDGDDDQETIPGDGLDKQWEIVIIVLVGE